MAKLIYKDDERTIHLVHGCLEIVTGGRKCPVSPRIDNMPNPVAPPAKNAAALKKAGKNPADYDAYKLHRDVYLTMPKFVTPAILAARDEYRAELDAIRNDPANIERNKISAMYAKAEKHINYPGDYYGILAEADAALKAWQAKYPVAAAREKAATLRAKADHQDSLATGALVYDADGWLTADDQERRAAEFKAKAAELRAEADKIEGNL